MIAIDLAHQLRERIASDIQVVALDKDRLVVYMPFIYDDGDQLSVFVSRDHQNCWRLSDDGDVLKRAGDVGFDISKPANNERLEKLINFYGVSGDDGSLILSANNESLVDSLFTLTQTCLEATWLAKTPRAPLRIEREKFSLKFDRLIAHAVPNTKREVNWHDPSHDPNRLYPVDVRLPGIQKQLFLFGVSNQASCMRATIALQHYRIAGAEFEAAAIYDREEDLPKRYTNQLNEVVDKRFPRIREKTAITEYLKKMVA